MHVIHWSRDFDGKQVEMLLDVALIYCQDDFRALGVLIVHLLITKQIWGLHVSKSVFTNSMHVFACEFTSSMLTSMSLQSSHAADEHRARATEPRQAGIMTSPKTSCV